MVLQPSHTMMGIVLHQSHIMMGMVLHRSHIMMGMVLHQRNTMMGMVLQSSHTMMGMALMIIVTAQTMTTALRLTKVMVRWVAMMPDLPTVDGSVPRHATCVPGLTVSVLIAMARYSLKMGGGIVM